MVKRLIVNADDFGRHELINAAVERGVTEGCLRSATLMPGGKAFASAVAVAKRHAELGVGIHFTLVNGYPVLPPAEIPSLVTAQGVFYDDHTAFVKRFITGKVNLEEVRAELAAQLQKLEQAGLVLTHADSHQHMHTLPGIIDIVLELAAAAGIKAVRTPRTPLFCGKFGGVGQLIGRLGLGTLAQLAAGKAQKRGLATPDHFAGIVAGEAVSEAYLREIIQQLQPGTTEVMMHPGTENAVLVPDCGWEHDFEAELAAIVSPAVRELAAAGAVEITDFRALYAED
ncbi:MAG: ChbG/HpnK family deacetylase [Selenomonas ruminantium]|jgi:hopanoid biosynthesis associated protein HpnK|nr:ChbG/HpnK family deacetylase [Selenomonas ruminantium]